VALALDTLVVFGYGPVERRGDRPHLNAYARLNALAAGMLLSKGHAEHLLITGGRTGGADLPSEAELMGAYVARVFGVSGERMTLEPHATDTVDNLVFTANLLDAAGAATQRLGFLALKMHLPRIRYLAELVRLDGEGLALEEVVAERSRRHAHLLNALRQSPSYAQLAASQVRAMRGLAELPEFWLPPLGRLENPARLRHVRDHPAVSTLGLPHDAEAFREALATSPRRYPEPHPDDTRLGLEAALG